MHETANRNAPFDRCGIQLHSLFRRTKISAVAYLVTAKKNFQLLFKLRSTFGFFCHHCSIVLQRNNTNVEITRRSNIGGTVGSRQIQVSRFGALMTLQITLSSGNTQVDSLPNACRGTRSGPSWRRDWRVCICSARAGRALGSSTPPTPACTPARSGPHGSSSASRTPSPPSEALWPE